MRKTTGLNRVRTRLKWVGTGRNRGSTGLKWGSTGLDWERGQVVKRFFELRIEMDTRPWLMPRAV